MSNKAFDGHKKARQLMGEYLKLHKKGSPVVVVVRDTYRGLVLRHHKSNYLFVDDIKLTVANVSKDRYHEETVPLNEISSVEEGSLEELLTSPDPRVRAKALGNSTFMMAEIVNRVKEQHNSGGFFIKTYKELRNLTYSVDFIRRAYRLCPVGTPKVLKKKIERIAEKLSIKHQLHKLCHELEKKIQALQGDFITEMEELQKLVRSSEEKENGALDLIQQHSEEAEEILKILERIHYDRL